MTFNFLGQNITVNLLTSKDRLTMEFETNSTASEVLDAFSGDSLRQVTINNDDGTVNSIYANHRVTEVHVQNTTPRVVSVTMQVDPLEVTEAQKLTEAVEAQKESGSVSEEAIVELADMITELEERVTALEAANNKEE